jgi:hypothetical protein
VRDEFGREGVVCTHEAAPTAKWLSEQVNTARLEQLVPPVHWCGVMPFGGGYLLCAVPLLQFLRPASFADFLALVDTASLEGRQRLANLFPEYVARVVSAAGSGPTP